MNKNKSVAVIGAGKLAWSFIPALSEAGYNIKCIISRSQSNAKEIAEHFNIKNYSDSYKDISPDCKVIFLSVPDDQLAETARQISHSDINHKLVIHFSGVSSSVILQDVMNKGGLTASLHIMQTFPSKKRVSIKECYAAVESPNKEAEDYLYALASDLGMNAFTIHADKKTEYHLAAVFASNFLVANMHAASKLFAITGSKINFNKVINPILDHTLKNIFDNGTANALSGPVERGDFHTIKLHVRSLQKDKNILRSYIIQSLYILDIKKEQAELSPAHKEIRDYLSDQLKSMS